MPKHACNSKVTQLNYVLLRKKDVLAFYVSVEDLPVMNVLHAETDLCEPIHDLRFLKIPATLVCYQLRNVTTVGIVHHNAKVALFRLVELPESHDVRMVEHLEDLGLLQRLFFLPLTHLRNVDLLDHAQVFIALTLDQVSFAKGSFA